MRNAVGGVQSLLILGGGSDIATATAEALATRGCRGIVLAARRPDDLGEVESRLRAAGAESVHTMRFDADDPASHDDVMDRAAKELGDIDAVLVAFAVMATQDEYDADPDRAVADVATNYVGTVSVGLRAAELLRDQGHGTLIFLSSVAGERVRGSNFVYGSSKAGMDGFAQGLGDALDRSGVDVMVVRPGFVRTKMTEGLDEVPFTTTPDAVADSIVKGLERGSHTVWSPPILRIVMSVLRHTPRAIFRRLPL